VRLELFDYPLPPERIAQSPIEPRDASRLLVLRPDGSREHRQFTDLPEYLNPGDLLVFNDTRVLPARVYGRKATGGRVELLLLQRLQAGLWEALAYPGRRLQEGARIVFGEGELRGEVVGKRDEGTRVIRFEADGGPEEADVLLHRLGEVPLPPYIHERLDNPERYQTIYSREEGSAAAPTAGLHFTPRVFEALREKGVAIAYVTLHVGIATFRPVKTETIEEHEMHEEWFTVPEGTARAIAECRGRVVAVGTTTVRCLESWGGGVVGREWSVVSEEKAPVGGSGRTRLYLQPGGGKDEGGRMKDETPLGGGSGKTALYLQPGAEFRVVDAILTNFHMPRSTLLILVSAFAGVDRIRDAYRSALDEGYRFLSFGDAMLIEKPAT
jgi:S-adenosylmethionine:tRNA ribosyltransferase-isomerase